MIFTLITSRTSDNDYGISELFDITTFDVLENLIEYAETDMKCNIGKGYDRSEMVAYLPAYRVLQDGLPEHEVRDNCYITGVEKNLDSFGYGWVAVCEFMKRASNCVREVKRQDNLVESELITLKRLQEKYKDVI